jgi:hypothetical protein
MWTTDLVQAAANCTSLVTLGRALYVDCAAGLSGAVWDSKEQLDKLVETYRIIIIERKNDKSERVSN